MGGVHLDVGMAFLWEAVNNWHTQPVKSGRLPEKPVKGLEKYLSTFDYQEKTGIATQKEIPDSYYSKGGPGASDIGTTCKPVRKEEFQVLTLDLTEL